MRVALFVTCLVDQLAPETGRSACRLLEAAGCDVEFPPAQTCCGQPAANSGYPDAACRLAHHFLDVFEPFEAVVSPSGSCTAMVRRFPELLQGPDRTRAEQVASKTHELTEFLVDVLERPDLGATSAATVAYHPSCHLLRELRVSTAPRQLLATAGATVTELDDEDRCCGFGGTFSAFHPEISVPMADAKLDRAVAAGAPTVVACDTGCLVHLASRAARRGLTLDFRHVADVVSDGLP